MDEYELLKRYRAGDRDFRGWTQFSQLDRRNPATG